MKLTDGQIKAILNRPATEFEIKPYPVKIEGIAVDLTLADGFRFMIASDEPIDLQSGVIEEAYGPLIHVQEKGIVIEPGDFLLGITAETVKIPKHMVGILDGKSTLARLGLCVHVTAGRIDPGWNGNIVLEFFNAGKRSLLLRPGMKIAAISFENLGRNVDIGYGDRLDARYTAQHVTQGAKC